MDEANWHMARDAGTKERPTYQHMGGTRLTTTAIPFSQADWIQHYGPVWESFRDAKKRFDPNNVLANAVSNHWVGTDATARASHPRRPADICDSEIDA